MARASMSALISLVRDLIGDPAGSDQIFTDDQIERSLDVHRWDMRFMPLKPLARLAGGEVIYLDWYSDEQYWEDDAALYSGDYTLLTPTTSDALHGRWSFAVGQSAVLVSGKVYDPFGAAADLLQMWSAKVSIEFDISMDGAQMSRSQKSKSLLELANYYRKQQRIVSVPQERSDAW